jgi:hypothetical protein
MTELFRYAEALAEHGFAWLDHPLGADRRELVAEHEEMNRQPDGG